MALSHSDQQVIPQLIAERVKKLRQEFTQSGKEASRWRRPRGGCLSCSRAYDAHDLAL
jgi:hypothetical protein